MLCCKRAVALETQMVSSASLSITYRWENEQYTLWQTTQSSETSAWPFTFNSKLQQRSSGQTDKPEPKTPPHNSAALIQDQAGVFLFHQQILCCRTQTNNMLSRLSILSPFLSVALNSKPTGSHRRHES